MPFTIQGLRLPFLKVSTTPKTGRTLVWHAGPWQYNARTGQHSLKLGKKVKYTSRTRTAKAAARKAKAVKRETERHSWDEHFASRTTGANAATPPPSPRATAKKTAAKKISGPRPPASKVRPVAVAGTLASAGGAATFADYYDTKLCRKPTADGGICQNMADRCPPGTHSSDAHPASLQDTRAERLARQARQAEASRARLIERGYPVLGDAAHPVAPAIGQHIAVCGARNRDGSPCSNTGRCPHHSRHL